jgi:hypothetical protein
MANFVQSHPHTPLQGGGPEAAPDTKAVKLTLQEERSQIDIKPPDGGSIKRQAPERRKCCHQTMIFRLPSVLTVGEVAFVMRLNPEVIRRRIRAKTIRLKNYSTPYRIPCRLLEEMGINLDDAAADLSRFWPREGSMIPPSDSTSDQAA